MVRHAPWGSVAWDLRAGWGGLSWDTRRHSFICPSLHLLLFDLLLNNLPFANSFFLYPPSRKHSVLSSPSKLPPHIMIYCMLYNIVSWSLVKLSCYVFIKWDHSQLGSFTWIFTSCVLCGVFVILRGYRWMVWLSCF